MILLSGGVFLWWATHLFKSLAPDARAQMGDRGKGLIALLILASVILMVIGYRTAEGTVYWGASPALVGINNLLVLLAFYILAAGGPKGPRIWIGTKLRHPQLVGFSIWSVAHLLVNGDTPSFILFGGLLIWALLAIVLINRREGAWTPPERAAPRKEPIYIVATFCVVGVIMGIHHLLGVTPWG